MLARQAKEIVKEWVTETASSVPGFMGALYHGSINWLKDDDPLPATSDIDVMVIVGGLTPPEKLGKFLYRGVIVDAAYLPAEQVRSAEAVLGISHLAGSLREGSIIADPTGQLAVVQASVVKDYTNHKWVARRCQHAIEKARAHLEGIREDKPLVDQVTAWLFGAGVTTHILLAAGLKNPTVRKRYLDARELLASYGKVDFYQDLLEMLGCAQMSPNQARAHLGSLEAAFDSAQAVIRSPFPFAADISPLARSVSIDGSRELIERGDHREAVFWITATYSRCMKALAQDGPAGAAEQHEPGYRLLLSELGIHTPADVQRRGQEVLEALPTVWRVAEEIMATNSEIKE